MTEIVIRRAAGGDLEAAAALFDAYRQFYGAASDVAAARDFLTARLERGESVVLLAFDSTAEGNSADPVGFAQVDHSCSSVSLGPIVVLNDLFVKPGARKTGAGRRLVAASAAYAAEAGALRLEVATAHTNGPALQLDQSLGFVPDTEFTHLSLPLRADPSRAPRAG